MNIYETTQKKRKRAKQHFSSMKDRQQTEAAQTVTERNPTPSGALPVPSSSTSSTNPPPSTNDSTSESSAAPDPQVSETFRSFVDQQRSLVTEDNTDDEPLFNTNTLPARGQTTRLPLLKLTEVFDFSNMHWVEAVRSAQENSFEKELEFYELLDLDAEGEDDSMDIDNTTEQVLGFE